MSKLIHILFTRTGSFRCLQKAYVSIRIPIRAQLQVVGVSGMFKDGRGGKCQAVVLDHRLEKFDA
jgi:hypothetical protein